MRHITALNALLHAFFAAYLTRLGNTEEAAAHVREALKQHPTLRVDVDCVPMLHYQRPADLAHHRDSLLQAGFAA